LAITDWPKITIVTPSFNQGLYIEETILSVLNQNYPNLEYIIIDGGSTDQSVEVIKKYSDHLHYWISEKDSGQSDAINKGFTLANGEIINWLNSDDQLMPGTLHRLAELFVMYPSVAMFHGRIEYFGETELSYVSVNLSGKDLYTRYVSHNCMPQPSCFFRKSLIEEQGYLDPSLHFSMDTDLYVRAGLHYRIMQVQDVFARFRLHSESKSVSEFNVKFLSDNAFIFSKVLRTLQANNEIARMKYLGLYQDDDTVYNTSARQFNTRKMLFYFIQHRLYSLYHRGQHAEFSRLFKFLLTKYPVSTLKSYKIILYRIFSFLPPGKTHQFMRTYFFRN
jgi:glycosyltransferase involved in cell wall biosynthesis